MVSPHHHSKHLHWHHISVKVPICQPPHSDLLHNAGNYKTKGYRVFLYWFIVSNNLNIFFREYWISSCSKSHIAILKSFMKKVVKRHLRVVSRVIFGICICSIVQQEFNCILAVFTSKKEESINHNIFIKIIYLQLCYQLKFCNSYAYSVICSVRILLIKISCSFSLKKNPFAKSLQ